MSVTRKWRAHTAQRVQRNNARARLPFESDLALVVILVSDASVFLPVSGALQKPLGHEMSLRDGSGSEGF